MACKDQNIETSGKSNQEKEEMTQVYQKLES